MAQEPGTWAALKRDASQDLLYFDPAAAVTGAEASIRVVDHMLRMRDAIRNEKLDDLVRIAGRVLTSGTKLTEIYIDRAQRLSTVLQDHADIGTDMGNAFVQAGLYYRRTEEQNADELDQLAGLSMPVVPSADLGLDSGPTRYDDLSRPDGEWQDAGRPGTEDDIRDLPAFGVPRELRDYIGRQEPVSPDAVLLEAADSLGFPEFRGLARDLPDEEQNIYDAALAWWRLAAHAKAELNRFDEAIAGIQDKWLGAAADRARAATRNYVDSLGPLWNSMFSMSENLHYTSEWLRRTHLSMPQQDFTFQDRAVEQATLARYRQEWTTHYGDGMQNSLREMPVIEGPIAEQKPPPNSGSDGENSRGGDNNGGNHDGEQNPQEQYERGYDRGYEEGAQQQGSGGGSGPGRSEDPEGSRPPSDRRSTTFGDQGSTPSGLEDDQQQGSGPGGGRGGGQGPGVPNVAAAEYGHPPASSPTPIPTGGSSESSSPAPLAPSIPAAQPGSTAGHGGGMPENPTAADVLGILTGVPAASMPDALKNLPITAKDGKQPTLADALAQVTGVPVTEMPHELRDTALEAMFTPDSPYAAVPTLFGADVAPTDSLLGGMAGGPQEPADFLAADGRGALDRLATVLTQYIQAYTQGTEPAPGWEQLSDMLDPSWAQLALRDMLDSMPTAGLAGGAGIGVGSGAPGAAVPDGGSASLAPYPEAKPSPFPRAALSAPGVEPAGSPGGYPGGMPGAPMMGGMGGSAAGGTPGTSGQTGNHTPSEYLTSRDNLDEVFDGMPSRVRPVIEQ